MGRLERGRLWQWIPFGQGPGWCRGPDAPDPATPARSLAEWYPLTQPPPLKPPHTSYWSSLNSLGLSDEYCYKSPMAACARTGGEGAGRSGGPAGPGGLSGRWSMVLRGSREREEAAVGHQVAYFEVGSRDKQQLMKFYGELFGWRLQEIAE